MGSGDLTFLRWQSESRDAVNPKTNEQASKVHKHLIKWVIEITKKEKWVLHMIAPRRHCLDYSKGYGDVTERWLLACNLKQK